MRFLRQSLVGLFLASVALALLVYAASLVLSAVQIRMSDDKMPPPARERVFAVNLVTASTETIVPVMEAFGQVQSRRTLELRTAMGGRIIGLSENFEEGGAVTAGEVLVQIDPANAQSELNRLRNDLMDAEAEGRDAERSLALARDELVAAQDQAELRERAFGRQDDLQSRGVGTAAAVEVAELAAAAARQAVLSRRQAVAQAEARLDQAATRLARAEIAVESARRDLAETTVMAAFDGVLSDVDLVEGRLVSANEKLALLVDPHALEVAFRISTAQYSRLLDDGGVLIPASVTATLDVSGAELTAQGRISRDSASAGDGQSGRLIFARLGAAPGFKPGDFVTVSVQEPAFDNVVRLPASALDASGSVLVIDADDRLSALPVNLIRRQGDDVLVRGAGLDGREVVVGRTPLLGPGIQVRPLRDEAASQPQPDQAMLELSEDRRAQLVAVVQANDRLPAEAKARILGQLAEARVPARLVQRIESRIGG
ncbi:HlyD family efflux transporter periplasmic adaptor subunit [Sedimentitalea sp. JM2-8]|uniref:HlyD family efflux transporter periplasmic adaptor subunit n=1 Tax=Sedimentitalea xiamensis TaxID=3050037 RepID=A0ABT7FB88_9RHOB|nr:HlyD family efflux transporter periplasmic adaptor subunit [Sedimentitalea xiamensis]MDK3072245.1 HlyD family efflux transporter periplasmic adaptor subunit [Sedimentitalea xiamensis]